MDGEFPWIYVAMIVIAFVSWVFNRIQEATAGRRRAEEIRQRQEDGDFDFEEEDFFDDGESRPEKEPPVSGEDAMRKLMEALGGTVVEAPKPPPPEQTRKPPPPLPPAAAPPPVPGKTAPPRMSAEERAALARLKKRNEIKTVPKKKAKSSLGEMSIADIVRDPDGIRKAVLLREILDRPRAERPWE